jgi:adenylate cyclase
MKKIKFTKFIVLLLITFFSISLSYLFSRLGPVKKIQLKSINSLFRIRGPVAPRNSSIVIVAIDDEALASLPGKWPYPAFYYSRLVTNLKAAGAKVIIFDIEFTDANTDHPEYDLAFAHTVAEAHNVILAGKIVFDVGSYGTESIRILKPVSSLLRTSAPWGIANVIEDSDGFLRRYMLFQNVARKQYYPLAIEALRFLEGAQIPDGQDIYAKKFIIGRHIIPKVTPNTMYVNFRGAARKSFKTISMAEVMDDSTFTLPGEEDVNSFYLHRDLGTFKDKIILIGATAEGLLDSKFTPFYQYNGQKRKMSCVEFHANALSTMLEGDYIQNINPWFIFVYVVLLTFLVGYLTMTLRPFKSFMVVSVSFVITIIIVGYIFIRLRFIVPSIIPILALLLSTLLTFAYQIYTRWKERSGIRQTFQNYVAPHIVTKMLGSGELPSFKSEKRELTVLHSNLRRFSRFSENYETDWIVSRLSEYLTEMVNIIFKNNGTLDKFFGAEIMTIFGAPCYDADHALLACKTSLLMVEKLKELQKKWSTDTKEYFQIGIGINSGKMIVGNLGSAQFFDYTVIGNEVDLGLKLRAATKKYETTIIISEATFNFVRDKVMVRELDIIHVANCLQPVRLYELRGMDRIPQIEQDYLIDVFAEGLSFYRQRRWADALKSFRRILRYFPSDGPTRLYTIRCLDYIEQEPVEDWDGVFELEEN